MKTTVGSLGGSVFARSVVMTLFLGCTAFASIQAQNVVPEEVLATFDALFPEAEEVTWHNDGEEYMAFFFQDEHTLEATIHEKGDWIQTLTYLDIEELPEAALEFILREFGRLDEYYTITKVEKSEVLLFRASFELKGQDVYLEFDENGKLLKKEVSTVG